MFNNYNYSGEEPIFPVQVDSNNCPVPISPVNDPFRYCGLYDYDKEEND